MSHILGKAYSHNYILCHYDLVEVQVGRDHWLCSWESPPAAAAVHTEGERCQGSNHHR